MKGEQWKKITERLERRGKQMDVKGQASWNAGWASSERQKEKSHEPEKRHQQCNVVVLKAEAYCRQRDRKPRFRQTDK